MGDFKKWEGILVMGGGGGVNTPLRTLSGIRTKKINPKLSFEGQSCDGQFWKKINVGK